MKKWTAVVALLVCVGMVGGADWSRIFRRPVPLPKPPFGAGVRFNRGAGIHVNPGPGAGRPRPNFPPGNLRVTLRPSLGGITSKVAFGKMPVTRLISRVEGVPTAGTERALLSRRQILFNLPDNGRQRSKLLAGLVHEEQLDGLTSLKKVLAVGSLLQESAEVLPARSRRLWRGVLATEDAAQWQAKSWKTPPDPADLIKDLQEITEAGFPKLAKKLQLGLIARALQEDQPEIARRLRNMQLVPPPAEEPRIGPVPQVGARPVIPEAPPGSQAGQRGDVTRGLAALGGDVVTEAGQMRRQLHFQLDWHHDFHSTLRSGYYHLALSSPKSLQDVAGQPAQEDEFRKPTQQERRQWLANIEQNMPRKLTLSERVLVCQLNTNQNAKQVAQKLMAADR